MKDTIKNKFVYSIILIFCFSILTENVLSQNEFPVGAFLVGRPDKSTTPLLKTHYYSVKAPGLNTVFQYCVQVNDPDYKSNKDSLMQITNTMPVSGFKKNVYVYHYTAGMYKKWEAENNQTDKNKIGIKHAFGNAADYENVQCWFSGTDTSNIDKNLIYGPNYLQLKKYPLYYNNNIVVYILNIRMIKKLTKAESDTVCKITVEDCDTGDDLAVRFVNESELQTKWSNSSIISVIYFHNVTAGGMRSIDHSKKLMDSTLSSFDKIGTVQFKIKWLTNIPIYIDYIEVYDDAIWADYKSNPVTTNKLITESLKKEIYWNWSEPNYRLGLDKPYYIDQYEPYRIIDSLITQYLSRHKLKTSYPIWNK